ncbi:hypothetical protein ACIGNX_27410 [Actinosynnema sp. NPDC053489]|uniref:hypothetical protein n=1 Tax=Actinosynnema sp. NPDC053489 TaxID=3363916 RepID=UPI0037C9794A
MTGRYGFADYFQIVDAHRANTRRADSVRQRDVSGQPFIGLALVEITARGGGSVEALFLDEGFGTLLDLAERHHNRVEQAYTLCRSESHRRW